MRLDIFPTKSLPSPLISVAITTFNGEKYLRQQLDSIYHQTYPNIEVVVCDDASSDSTISILEEYRNRSGLNYCVNSHNIGLVKNFEKAISLCRGDFIALCDQDDIWKPEKLETLFQAIGEFTLIYSPTTEIIDSQGLPIEDVGDFALAVWGRYKSSTISSFGTGCPTKNLIVYNWVVSHQVMFRRELIEVGLPIPSSQVFHDAWLALHASKLNGIKFLDVSLIQYRLHRDSFTFIPDKSSSTNGINMLQFLRARRDRKKLDSVSSLQSLQDISKISSLNESEKEFVKELEIYFSDICKPGIHWQAFNIVIRYRKLFCWDRDGIFSNAKFLIDSLAF
jgi:glycosyltransferase involved in cell wall biosynthesis